MESSQSPGKQQQPSRMQASWGGRKMRRGTKFRGKQAPLRMRGLKYVMPMPEGHGKQASSSAVNPRLMERHAEEARHRCGCFGSWELGKNPFSGAWCISVYRLGGSSSRLLYKTRVRWLACWMAFSRRKGIQREMCKRDGGEDAESSDLGCLGLQAMPVLTTQ